MGIARASTVVAGGIVAALAAAPTRPAAAANADCAGVKACVDLRALTSRKDDAEAARYLSGLRLSRDPRRRAVEVSSVRAAMVGMGSPSEDLRTQYGLLYAREKAAFDAVPSTPDERRRLGDAVGP